MISIISPVLGTSDKVRKFISSILSLSYTGDSILKDIELVIIDDGSSVDLRSTVMDYYPSFKERNWNLKFIRNDVNCGRAYSRNRAAEQATYEWLFFVDIDNLIQENCLNNLLAMIANSNDDFVARANVRCHLERRSESNYVSYFDSRYLGNRVEGDVEIDYRYFASDAFIIKKDLFNFLNGFDESFRHYGCEDEEFGIRLRNEKIKFYFCSNALLIDDDNPTLDRACTRIVSYSRYSVPLLVKKHPKALPNLLFPAVEKENTPVTLLLKIVLSIIVNLKLNDFMRVILNKLDNKRRYYIPSLFYKAVLAAYYIKGYNCRGDDD